MTSNRPDRPLNVVRVISFMNVGGVQGMLLKTLPHFDRERFNIRVVCTTRNGEIGRQLQSLGIPVDVVRVLGRLNPFDLHRLARWIEDANADIVHTHQYASNISGVLAARWAGRPVIVSHIHATHEWHNRSRALLDRFNDRFRDGYIAVSEAVRDAFLKTTGLACKDKIKVLYNVVNSAPNSASISTPDPAFREKWGIPQYAPVVGVVTRLVPVKGLDVLLRAAKLVIARRPDVRFVLVGKGKLKDELPRLAAELGIEKNVLFTGEQVQTADFYAMFDVFALSSRSEGLGNVILEAMRFAKPIVATHVGGIPELVRDGHTGLLVEPESPASLADGIEKLLADRDLAGAFAANASEFVKKFTVESYVGEMQNYYDRLYENATRFGKDCHESPVRRT